MAEYREFNKRVQRVTYDDKEPYDIYEPIEFNDLSVGDIFMAIDHADDEGGDEVTEYVLSESNGIHMIVTKAPYEGILVNGSDPVGIIEVEPYND